MNATIVLGVKDSDFCSNKNSSDRKAPRPIRSTGSATRNATVVWGKPAGKMICCCGGAEETYAVPASRHPAAPTSQNNAGEIQIPHQVSGVC